VNRDALLAVVKPFGEAAPLPRVAFLDPAMLELEQRAIFDASWMPVAHEADLRRPGDWVRAPLRGEHVIVIRGSDLGLAALHATCSHRGTLLLDGDAGQLSDLTLRCPYHGWRYATDGSLLEAPGAAPGEKPPGLGRARVETRAGVVFVNVGAEAPPELPPWLTRAKLHALERAKRTDHEVRANWKVLVGNFQESHHFRPCIRASRGARRGRARRASRRASAGSAGRWSSRPGSRPCPRAASETDGRSSRPRKDRGRVFDALVFPLWLTSLQPDYLLTYRLAPFAVDRTLVVAEIHVHKGALAEGVDLEDVFSFWERTNAEDRAICERQQLGLAARHGTPLRYAQSEDGLHAFERLVAARCLEALSA
jgi:Rieske 2Fe-2S family protein